jgi:hypothetical protein
MKTFVKDPDAVLDYKMDWADWLNSTDTIIASSWVAGTGLTVDSNTNSGTYTTVWLSGGTAGSTYLVTNSIETSEGRQDDRTIMIQCMER